MKLNYKLLIILIIAIITSMVGMHVNYNVLISIVAGAFSFGGGIYLLIAEHEIRDARKKNVAVKDQIDYIRSYSSTNMDGHTCTLYKPTMVYCYKGVDYKREYARNINPSKYKVGDTVAILIDPEDPKNFNISGLGVRQFIILGILGAIMFYATSIAFILLW